MRIEKYFIRFIIFFFTGFAVFILIGILFVSLMRKTPTATPHPSASSAIDHTHDHLIRVRTPKNGAMISSPLIIEGEAVGNWFFEASFPVQLVDEEGREIARSHAQALSDWMTTDFVPFRSELQFPHQKSKQGILILKKDNPSSMPEMADEIQIPVRFQ